MTDEDKRSAKDEPRTVKLREEHDGLDSRYLRAYLDENGDLNIKGQDFGPATAAVSDDGEYEWSHTIARREVPRLVQELGGQPGQDVLDLLVERYCGRASYDLEKVLRESRIEMKFWCWP